MHSVLVVGASLAGMAAAARLAKAGHRVELWEATDRLGGRLAATPGPQGVLVDAAPAIIGFPAPWRDLFRKSGRTLEAELARNKTELVPAGPVRYEFADGSRLELSSDRGEQHLALSAAYGTRVAERWRDLLDWLDDVWQAVRPLGLERELTAESQLSPAVRRLLRPDASVADLATEIGHPGLAAIVRASAYRQGAAPEQTPAWAAVTLSVERRFGRWCVRAPQPDPTNRSGRTSTVVEALAARLSTRKVPVERRRLVAISNQGGAVLARAEDGTQARPDRLIYAADPWRLDDLLPWTALRRTRRQLRRLTPALSPAISHSLVDPLTRSPLDLPTDPPVDGAADTVSETVELSAVGVPTHRYRRPTTAGTLESVHDFDAASPTAAAGTAWHGFASWFRRPPIQTSWPGLILTGPWTAAGNGLSPTLLAGALASYAAHD